MLVPSSCYPHSTEKYQDNYFPLSNKNHSSHSQFTEKAFKSSAKDTGWTQLVNTLPAVVKKPMNLQCLIALHHPAKILCHHLVTY